MGGVRALLTPGRRTDWATPPEVVDYVRARFGPIILDPAASDGTACAPFYLTPAEDGLKALWGRRFCLRGCRSGYRVRFDLARYLPRSTRDCFACGAEAWSAEDGVVYVNPPYGRAVGRWVEKAVSESTWDVVMLLPARTDTAWFRLAFEHAALVIFFQGRLRFAAPDGAAGPAPFPSALVHLSAFRPAGGPRVELLSVSDMQEVLKCPKP